MSERMEVTRLCGVCWVSWAKNKKQILIWNGLELGSIN
jgi:hypothetical protein